MAEIKIKTGKKVIPMLYGYSTPEIARHNGWTKIGYTEQTVEERLNQQTHTADVEYKEEWRGNAIFDDGSSETFTDKDFHRYLKKNGVEKKPKTEWFHIDGPCSHQKFLEFRVNRGIMETLTETIEYKLRDEQAQAVELTNDYRKSHEQGEYLWNAKPRFGKTLAAYDLCKLANAQRVLIVTNRPAISNSWYSDYVKFLGTQSGYWFVSNTDSLQNKPYVVSRKDFVDFIINLSEDAKVPREIRFVSLQDLKGSIYANGKYDKLKDVFEREWDVLIIDEAHEGVDTIKSENMLGRINRKFTLHLSGTPFKALANEKFSKDAIFNWTYVDEQNKKEKWIGEPGENNPYADLPKLNLYTYQLSEIIKEELGSGLEIDGEQVDYSFDLNSFFETKNGKFIHDDAVDRFLDALTTQKKFPFSTDELRNELKHTFWLLDRVDSANALYEKLSKHPVFKEYKVIPAVGVGKKDDETELKKAFDKVTKAIQENDKTITLSVGQLTVGITIPEWTAVLMLSNIKSPSQYMQTAFRAQNPCLFSENGSFYRKENAYVFDFDPARTLDIFEEFANDLSADTSNGKGDIATRKEHVKTLLNFFPVLGEDENGEMVKLDAEKVLSIPRKIRSKEVVKRGFMCNYLFQNISNVFGAPAEVIDILNQFEPVGEAKSSPKVSTEDVRDLKFDEDGNAVPDEAFVIGKDQEIFGEKVYEIEDALKDTISSINTDDLPKDSTLEYLKEKFKVQAQEPIIGHIENGYGSDLKPSDKKRLKRIAKEDSDRFIDKAFDEYSVQRKLNEAEREELLKDCSTAEEISYINSEYDSIQDALSEKFKSDLNDSLNEFIVATDRKLINEVEMSNQNRLADEVADSIRSRLRGFARSIPSFLMAYGSDEVTLENFDTVIPENVFKEVTGVELAQFKFLRDGGPYTDSATGEEKHFEGKLFSPVVFNDSIKEFLALKDKLANYFDESQVEDIFDYIPPQKTNQIFTPKKVVRQMVDLLEKENPGCFGEPDKTFADLYMKSGLYITEIVKRLYNNDHMKQLYPDSNARLKHIFEHQVYGLAPTEIIYRIATNYILGFNKDACVEKHNFRCFDALPAAQDGTLGEKLEEIFK